MSLLLDTNILIYAYRNQGACRAKLEAHSPADLCISTINALEIEVGILKAVRPEALRRFWDDALRRHRLLTFDLESAQQASRVRAHLEAAGTPIGPYDLQIAGIALAHDLIVVTRNVREFSRVPGLRVEDWYDGRIAPAA